MEKDGPASASNQQMTPPADVSPREAAKQNAESVKAASVQLPPGSDSDEDTTSVGGSQEASQENGTPPASTGGANEGWGALFLQSNAAAAQKATDAMAEEIAKKGEHCLIVTTNTKLLKSNPCRTARRQSQDRTVDEQQEGACV